MCNLRGSIGAAVNMKAFKGYRPEGDPLDTANPPRGGSGVPRVAPQITEQDWDSFLEMLYRALSMITRWIEKRRKRKTA